tara:strand:- start:49 stop:489 length:441 start_codon:yes stop_codon:yes gene_type:complete
LSEALKSISANEVVNFPRSVVNTASSDGMAPLGFMPAVSDRHALLGYKVVSVFERNVRKGLNPHQGMEACLLESEEIISALKAGRLTQSTIVGELGDVLNHPCQGRASSRSITLFKSVGLSIEDVFAADYFYQQAIAKELGQEIIL